MGDEIVFNVTGGRIAQMPATTLKQIGFKERADLQSWIEKYPEIVDRDLLVITTEFNQWELRANGSRIVSTSCSWTRRVPQSLPS